MSLRRGSILLALAGVLWACIAGAAPALGQGATVSQEAVSWLRDYLQIDTTNPPGNEGEAVDFLAEILRTEGFEVRRLESPEGRANLYTRWRVEAGREGPALVLLHHIDVVPAGDAWQQPPFSGRLKGDTVWGRGALDVKGLGIAQLAALVQLRREGFAPSRDLIYLAVADEELGGGQGTRWLLDAQPELFDGVQGVLNEGGSNRVLQGHIAFWGVAVAQKRPFWLKITATGRGGHASGYHPSSASHRLIRGLARLVDRPEHYRLTEPARLYFAGINRASGGDGDLSQLEARLASDDPMAGMMPGMNVYFVDTLQVTRIENGETPNAVAPVATAWVDGRLLPDTDADALLEEVRDLVGRDLSVELLLSAPAVPPSPRDHPVWHALEEVLGRRAPLIPTFLTGTTDSRFFRQRGIPAYGLSPFTIDAGDLRGIHGRDESIPVDEFLRGIETLRRVVEAYAGREP